jgi:hypothetical protein
MTQAELSKNALAIKRASTAAAASEHVPLRFIDEQATSEVLGVPVGTLRNWRWRGEGPAFHKFGVAVRYELGELYAYAQSCRRTSTSQAA